MNHKTLRKLVLLSADGTLSEQEQALAQKHIKECAQCAADLQRLSRIQQTVKEFPAPKVRPFFAQRVMAEYRASAKERFWTVFEGIPRPLLLAALSLSIMLIFLTIPQSARETESLNLFTQFYSTEVPYSLESDEQALAFLIKNELPSTTGERQ